MRPDLAAATRTFQRRGNPAPASAIELQLDDQHAAFIIRLRPHPRAKTPIAGLDAFDARETAPMNIRQMLPIDRVLIEALDADGQHAQIGAEVRDFVIAGEGFVSHHNPISIDDRRAGVEKPQSVEMMAS
jgi:hypothetical protein